VSGAKCHVSRNQLDSTGMKLLVNQLDKPSLSKFGEEACRLFIARDFQSLANIFGYAFAYDRDIATAIEADFAHCLSGHCTQVDDTVESVIVRNFLPNDTGLLSVIACTLLIDNCARILIELIVAKKGEDAHLYLEDISAIA
jgi:hypothetical protein